MKIRAVYGVFLFLACVLNGLHAQTGMLMGEVTGADGQALADANVYLLRTADSSVVKVALTEADGKFEFDNLKFDTLLLVIKQLEHQTYLSENLVLGALHDKQALPRIQLQPLRNTKLETVTIVSKLPVVEQKIDRMVVNVDALITVAGGSAIDALERSPGISVDQNGDIKLKGKSGVMVYIDDKPTYLSGDNLANYLRSLPSSTLKSIEIMTNPPAKYDAAGNAGIINIRTKKNNIRGMNGSLALGYRQGRYLKSNNSFNFNYRRNKFNLFTTLGLSDNVTFQDLYIDRNYLNLDGSPSSFFRQRSYIKSTNITPSAKLGIDYYVSEKTTFGIVANGFLENVVQPTANLSQVLDANEALQRIVYADNRGHQRFQNASINVNFRHEFDSIGRSLTVDADHLAYLNRGTQVFKNDVYSPEGLLTYHDQLDGNTPSQIKIYAAKSDYNHPFKNGLVLGAGVKAVYTTTDNAVNYDRTVDGVTTTDYSISNRFIYREKIGAAYLNLNKEWKRFGMQAGLRAESTRSDGNQLGNPFHPATEFKRRYDNLFPTLYLNYKLDSAGNHNLNFSYGKRIDRPYFQDLNPFLSPLDKFTFYSGNPFLKPAFAQSISLAHTFKNNFSTTLSYNRSRGEINETLEIVNGIYYSRPGNIGSSEFLTLSVTGTIPFSKWLSTNIYTEMGRNHYLSKLYNQKLDARGNYLYAKATNMFQFGKGWSSELSGEWMSNFVSAQVSSLSVGFVNAGVKKNILHDKGSIKIGVTDMLRTRRFRGIINNLTQTYATFHSTIDSRLITFSFSYRFGKSLGDQRQHNGGSADGEKGRVKN
jgi:Outer membrane protein beta-barrel family